MPKGDFRPKAEAETSPQQSVFWISNFGFPTHRAGPSSRSGARACHAQAKQRRINAAFDDEIGLPADVSAETLAKAEASAQAGVG